MKGPDGKRMVSSESSYHIWMKRVQEKHGEFVNEGKEWSDGEVDLLLDAYVRGVSYDAPAGVACLASALRRSREAVKCKIYKLSVRHPQGRGDQYTPDKERRSPQDDSTPGAVGVNEREMVIVGLALSIEGRRNGAHLPDYLGKLLARPADRIRLWLTCARENIPLLMKGQLKNESVDDWNARIVAEALRKTPHALEELL